jgi:hypothetical protein
VANKNGTAITYTLITGGGLGMTHYLPTSEASPETVGAPINAKEIYGMTVTTDSGVITVENEVRFLIAAPRDDLRMWTPLNALFLGGFTVNSDYYGGSFSDSLDLDTARNPRFKRGVSVVHFGE